ncbi:MAG: GTPase HflX [Lachnospiraceae bacterium]
MKAILVGLNINNDPRFSYSLEELEALANACDMEVVCIHTQNLPFPNKALYIGTGKTVEVAESVEMYEADTVIFDDALSPMQLRNLSNEIHATILDRTALILQIFSTRAKTKEAKLQVNLANLQYMLPRLAGLRTNLGRQGGGSGSTSNKGAGEKKIELDRRKIEQQITVLKQELSEIKKNRETMRKQRSESNLFQVALVGYTNAGKSTLMNQFLDRFVADESKKILAKDMLFATLETTVRYIEPEDKRSFLLSDTVGFINKLPHNLVDAFRSTLEEVKEADLLLHVIDFSDPNYLEHIRVTNETLDALDAASIPVLYLYNKSDAIDLDYTLPKLVDNKLYMSAKEDSSIDKLLDTICNILYNKNETISFLIPYTKGNIVTFFNENTNVKSCEYLEGGTLMTLNCTQEIKQKYSDYIYE